MNLYINKKFIGNYQISNNSFYQSIEINDLNLIEIKPNQNCEIFITNNTDYFKEHIIRWNIDGLSNYKLENGNYSFLNCDMYDDFLEFKISIKKENDKIYLNSIKHILNLKDIIFKN